MNLKTLNAQLGEVRRAQAGIAAKLGDLSAEKFELESEARDKAVAVEAAEVALVAALADAETGLPADVPAARKALDEAKAQAAIVGETATRLRVLDALRGRHESEHAALHEKGLSVMAAIRAAELDAITAKGADLLADTEAAMATVARNACLLAACQSLTAERGASWPHAVLNEAAVTYRHQITQNQARDAIADALAA